MVGLERPILALEFGTAPWFLLLLPGDDGQNQQSHAEPGYALCRHSNVTISTAVFHYK
jgi:hypothetical protein